MSSGRVTPSAALVVAGMWVKRFLIIVPPLQMGLFGEVVPSYKGSPVEWIITLGAVAAVPLFLMLLFRIFPVLPIHEMEEIAAEESEKEYRPALKTGLAQEQAK